jgi:hypothetical protein
VRLLGCLFWTVVVLICVPLALGLLFVWVFALLAILL